MSGQVRPRVRSPLVLSRSLLRPYEVADQLGVARDTLRKWRRLGAGPPWIKLGNNTVRYDPEGFDAWRRAREEP